MGAFHCADWPLGGPFVRTTFLLWPRFSDGNTHHRTAPLQQETSTFFRARRKAA